METDSTLRMLAGSMPNATFEESPGRWIRFGAPSIWGDHGFGDLSAFIETGRKFLLEL